MTYKYAVRRWNEFIWLTTGTIGRLLLIKPLLDGVRYDIKCSVYFLYNAWVTVTVRRTFVTHNKGKLHQTKFKNRVGIKRTCTDPHQLQSSFIIIKERSIMRSSLYSHSLHPPASRNTLHASLELHIILC